MVGKHNHGFLSTVFLGSVASSVMRKSPCPFW
ncbi:MAG: universal stress protein [Akkermansia sp.]